MSNRLIVYVDGFNFYYGIKEAGGHELLWVDLVKLSRDLRPESTLLQVKYFTATVPDEPEAQARQDSYLQALKEMHPGTFTPVLGKYQRKDRVCQECGARKRSWEEKQTDVNMAVHLIADVSASKADTFMVMTGDTDVIPAIKMARDINPSAVIIAHFPPRRESKAIKRILPSSRTTTVANVLRAQFPDQFVSPLGNHFARPEKWRSKGLHTIGTTTATSRATPLTVFGTSRSGQVCQMHELD